MAGEVRVNFSKGKSAAADIKNYSHILSEYSREIEQISRQLDGTQQSLYQIKSRLRKLSSETMALQEKTFKYSETLLRCISQYSETEQAICGHPVVMQHIERPDNAVSTFDLFKLFGIDWDKDGDDKFTEWFLNLWEKAGASEAGAVNDFMKYINSLLLFYIKGDNRGFSGLENLCDIGEKSSDLWKGLYELINAKDITGLIKKKFADIAGVVGVFGSLFGLVGGLAKAFNMDGKTSGAIFSDWMGVTDNITGVFKEIYKAAGGESTGYFTLAQTIQATIGQIGESYSKYSADGDFSFADLNETAIDASITGLAKLIKGVTFGIVDIDGDYASEAAKNWAGDRGKSAGNRINNDPELLKRYNEGNALEKFAILTKAIFSF